MGAIKRQEMNYQQSQVVVSEKKEAKDEGRLTRLEVLGALVAVPIGWFFFVIFGCLR